MISVTLLNMQDSFLEEPCAPDFAEEIKAARTTGAAMTNLCVLSLPSSATMWRHCSLRRRLGTSAQSFKKMLLCTLMLRRHALNLLNWFARNARVSGPSSWPPSHYLQRVATNPLRAAPFYQSFKTQPRQVYKFSAVVLHWPGNELSQAMKCALWQRRVARTAHGSPRSRTAFSFLSLRGVKREQLRSADSTRLRCFALHFVPTREFQERPRRLTPVVRRFAPTGSTLVFMWDALSASLAGRAMCVTSDVMSPIGRNREFG